MWGLMRYSTANSSVFEEWKKRADDRRDQYLERKVIEIEEKDTKIEIERYKGLKYVVGIPRQEAVKRWTQGTVNRLAILVKEKPDGGV